MGNLVFGLLVILFLLKSRGSSVAIPPTYDTASLNRSTFPRGFIFGTASASYQYEGAAKEGGKGPSTWDTFTHRYPDKITDHSNGDVAVDQYHHYKEDVGIMKDMGLDAYRFSISWSRLLPNGKLSGGVNREGINYYSNLINELLEKGGNSATEPYIVTHHQLLAHAAAVKVYKQKYQAIQEGTIGITLVSPWLVPYSNSTYDRASSRRALDFMFGWFMDPLTNGDYPHIMRSLVGNRLPNFSREQSMAVKGSFDFIGLNYYTTNYAAHAVPDVPNAGISSYLIDMRVNVSAERNGIPIGPRAASDWLYVYPRGIHDVLLYTKIKYHNPLIYITENGIDEFNNASLSLEESLRDSHRIDYHYRHLAYLDAAIKDGVNVKGYFAWSLLDNFEWNSGYTLRFGIYYIDYKDGLKRHPKLSAHWFKHFLKK